MHQGCSVSDRGEHPELRGAERGACRERDGSRPDILAAVADVLAGVPAVAHSDAAALERLGVLLADHGVGARGKRRAREDPDRLARTHRLRGKAARGDGLDHRERDGALRRGAADVLGTGPATSRYTSTLGSGARLNPSTRTMSAPSR